MANHTGAIRSRIVEFLPAVPARDLLPDARNYRRHPKAQSDALRATLADIGYADALLARRTPGGLRLIDGHLRASLDPSQVVPVLVLDLDEQEAGKLLLTLDPLAAMAQSDGDALIKLLDSVRFEDPAINAMLEALANNETKPLPDWSGEHGPTGADIQAREGELQTVFEDRTRARAAGMIDLICPECGHGFSIQRGDLDKESTV